jgi:tyrosyl-tRNA synthetase
MFNMMAGRDLMKAMGMRNKYVMTLKLLADDKGKKMGKSEGNAVFLDQAPENMYGVIMSWPDGVLGVAFELCTKMNLEEIKKIKNKLKDKNTNPRDFKMLLAYEVTRLNHGKDKADKAQEHFIKTVQKKEVPDEVKSVKLKVKSINILELLLELEMVSSKGEARRLIKQKGIKINGEAVESEDMEVELSKEAKLLQRGKRNFIKVISE